MSQKKGELPKQEITFEEAMERLETIVEHMESDKIPLEELLVQYEEGINLVQVCTLKLDAAEKRIEILTKNGAGKTKLEDFQTGKTSKPEDTSDPGEVSLF